uniref:Uncharacterized protein n=1 Tax=Arundo donax TaxID=35708 RepID=A0A0A9GAC7_ARUDO
MVLARTTDSDWKVDAVTANRCS